MACQVDSEIFATQNILNLLDFFVGIQVSFSNSTYLTKVQVPITYNDSEMFEELMKPSFKIKKGESCSFNKKTTNVFVIPMHVFMDVAEENHVCKTNKVN